ncbi:hypothetical protein BC937DRAFT_92429, partial [Endogone sp. FLAS-F59071]
EYTCTFILPSFNGLFRGLQDSPYIWQPSQLNYLIRNMQPLLHNETLSHIRQAISNCLKATEHTAYSRRILAKYWEDGPLSNNKIIFDMMILLRNALARVVVNREMSVLSHSSAPVADGVNVNHDSANRSTSGGPTSSESIDIRELIRSDFCETWRISNPSSYYALPPTLEDAEREQLARGLRAVYVMSLGYFTDIKGFSDQSAADGKRFAPDAYWKDIMGTSLPWRTRPINCHQREFNGAFALLSPLSQQVAALCSVYLHEVDDVLINRLSSALFDISITADVYVQMASLDVATILAIKYVYFQLSIRNHIRDLKALSSVSETEMICT